MSDADFARFRNLIESETGISVDDSKRALVIYRLARLLRRLDLESYEEYYAVVMSDPTEKVRFIDAICTNETRFFREPRQFDFLRTQCVPDWKKQAETRQRNKQLRIWSAACSSGEEPYSLAMICSDLLPATEGWDVRITATDLSTRVLDDAREGVWPISRSTDIPHDYLRRFMLRGVRSRNGTMRAGAEIRRPITFARVNLAAEHYPVEEIYDAIFCRNVLIYFEHDLRVRIVQRLLERLAVGGHLFLGHAETLNGMPGARLVAPNVYVR